MRSQMIFGALLVSVALCSQGFGFELLERVLGRDGDCGECKAAPCAPCAKCAPTCAKPCAPTCAKPCAPTCEKVCLPNVCEKPFEKKCHPTPVRDLFDHIADMFEAKAVAVDTCGCEGLKCRPETCCKAPCAPKTCEKCTACGKTCAVPTCEKVCKPKTHKLYRRPVLELIENLFGCEESECGCEAACNGSAPAPAPKANKAKSTEAAPVPAPKADPRASTEDSGVYQASRSLVRN